MELRGKSIKSPAFPSKERLAKGPVAIIECPEEIPCNPCESICPNEAVKIGRPITNLPELLEEKCNGCGLCLPSCPGLAIFVVDLTHSKDRALVEFPFEFIPLPKVGAEVAAVNGQGKIVTPAKVVRIKNPKKYGATPIIAVAVPKEHALEVRGIVRERRL